MGSGLAWLDYDNDGWMDLYVVQSGPFPARLGTAAARPPLPQRGEGVFTDVTEKAGLARHGVTGWAPIAADYDNDGFPDLFVTNFGRNILYHNNGDGTFTDVTDKAGVAGSGWSTSAAFADFDGDGYLDLFVVRYLDYSVEKNYFCGDAVDRQARVLPPEPLSADRQPALPQQRRRDVHGRDRVLGRRRGARQGARRRRGGPRRRREARHLRRVRHDDEPSLPQPRRDAVRGRLADLRRRRELRGAGLRRHGRLRRPTWTATGCRISSSPTSRPSPTASTATSAAGVFEDVSGSSGFGPPALHLLGLRPEPLRRRQRRAARRLHRERARARNAEDAGRDVCRAAVSDVERREGQVHRARLRRARSGARSWAAGRRPPTSTTTATSTSPSRTRADRSSCCATTASTAAGSASS